MKKTIKLFGVVLAAAAMFAACVQDSEVKPAEKATTLSIEPTTIEAEIAPNGPFDVQVKANGTWVVVNSLDWVTVEPNKGEGDATVQVTVAANEKDGEQLAPRSGEISFIGAATCSQTLAIAQAGNEDLLIESVPYTINFCETQGTWTIEDKTLPEALTYVWAQTEKYGMKASAYLNQCYATESWLISPVFDLTKETVAILNIEHALNKGSNAKCAVMAKTTDSAEWVKLDVPTWPGTANEDGSYTGSSWDFVESGDIDLTAFCGKKAQIAFVYGSTDADAPTWEIKTVVVTNDASPKFSVPTEDINIRAFDTQATIKVSGNVDWTAVASEGATVEPAEGKGGLSVTVTVPENTDMENAKEYTVTFKTTAAVETAEYVVKIIQAKAEELPATTLAEIFEKGVGVYATGELTVMAKASGNVIVSDGTANMMFYKANNELVPGQVIKFANADVQERNGLLQINSSEFELLEKTVTPEYGTAVEIATDEDVQNWGGEPQYQYIHFTGVMGDDNRTIKCGEWGIYIVKTEGFAGKKVSVYGYANGTAGAKYQTITTTLVSIEEVAGEEPGPEPTPATTLAEIFEKGVGTYATGELTVMAKAAGNVIVSDGTANMMYYKKDNELVTGQVIKFESAAVSERNGLLQINGSDYVLIEKTVTPEYGTAVEIATDEQVQNWGGEPQYQYIHFTGVMGDDNRTIKCGEWGIYIVKTEGFAGKKVSVYGYANGKATSYQTITTTLVSIEEVAGEEPGPEPTPATTLAEIFEKGVGTYATGELTVMAKAAGNVIVSDGTANMMYYKKDNELVTGQVIKFESAAVSERNGLLQINGSDYVLIEKTVTPEYGTAVEIATDEQVQNWGGEPQYQYIHFTGVMGDDNRTIKCGEWGIYIVKTEGFAGKKVSVYGYANGKATSYQTITTTLVSIEEVAGEEPGPEPTPATTLAEIFEKGVGTYATGELTVMAKAAGNVIVSDGTANMMYYKKDNELVTGQVIKFESAAVSERNGLLQINGSDYVLIEKTVTPEYGTAVEIATDEQVQNWGGEPQYQYIHFTGVMGDDNRTIKCGEWGIYIVKTEGFAGKKVSVYGYANGTAGAKYQTITTTLVSIEEVAGEEPGPEPTPATTLAEIFEKGVGTYATGELTVMAKAAGNVIVSDGTANMMFYKSGNELVPGQVIKFANADVQERNGLLQINSSEFELLEKTVTPEYGTAVEIATDEDVQNWGGVPQYQYIHFTGVMGNDNRTIKVGDWGIYIVKTEGYAGNTVSVYGYANGKATSYQTITTTLVSIEATEIPGIITVKNSVSLEVGATAELAATVNSGAALSYASADETVATVSAEGVVTAVKEGTTTITVSAPATGIYTAATAEVAVTVKAASTGGDGNVLYEDKFDWLVPFNQQYAETAGKKIGDTVGSNNTDNNAPNAYTTAPFNTSEFAAAFAGRGYVDLNPGDKLIYPQDAYLKFSKTGSYNTGIELDLSQYVSKTIDAAICFDFCMMIQGSGKVDAGPVTVVIIGDGTFEDGTKRADFTSTQETGQLFWNKAEAKMLGITPNTKLHFLMGRVIQEDGSYNWHVSGAGRFFLDNIVISK